MTFWQIAFLVWVGGACGMAAFIGFTGDDREPMNPNEWLTILLWFVALGVLTGIAARRWRRR